MNILLANDDGYNAEGILTLYNVLNKDHNVYLCAPLTQKSAASHSVTLFKSMEIKEVEGGYAVDGTPVDCVKVALFGVYKDINFDLVISGINNGSNMGDDIFYSGTVAVAREGLINKIPGLACSMDRPSNLANLQAASRFINSMISKFSKDLLKEKFILNINFPSSDNFSGARITHLGNRLYNETIYMEENDGIKYASIVGDGVAFLHNEGSDLNCIDGGHISITPLKNEYFAPPIINQLDEIIIEMEKLL
ncbi:MAG TPA: 5'/3'-nucleotidase SurE [Victivallales bacterium]|nr:5'/3'-nucleotidase SurE [Victivallales bacterium]